MHWMWTGSSTKSTAQMEELVEFLKSDDFKKEEIMGFDVKKETANLDKLLASPTSVRDGWKEVSVNISVPDGKPHNSESDAPVFSVPGLHFRPLVEVIKSAVHNAAARTFHYTPFKQFWSSSSPDDPPQRIYDEIYSSDAMAEAYTTLQKQPPEPGCNLERVILSLMFWSDSTHLASFGNASLWPLYLFFGNQSKWLRVKPRTDLCHHVAYFPKLPDMFTDWFQKLTGKAPAPEVLTHCRRELMHAIWRLLLDDEFMHAYEHGIVIQCTDGIFRRFYPRIFTYSADYPEKILLATIRNLGKSPCPRCLLPKEQIRDVGTVLDTTKREKLARVDDSIRRGRIDRVRTWIYERGYAIKSAAVERYLQPFSETPTRNAFSERLSKFGFNPFRMLVPDFMHEFELGVFKAFFVHLLRILSSAGGDLLTELDRRFRLIPTFGQSTIRRFTANTSGLKKLAAWNWQSILVCAIPVVDGLLPEPWNGEILDMLFTLAEWHSLGKLKMHTNGSIALLKTATKEVGRLLRRFQKKVCAAYPNTKELPSEEAARGRRQAKKATTAGKGKQRAAPGTTTRNAKGYNLSTYKLHALGDYVPAILWFGTSDSYSTQPGELEHRRVKRFYARTNKNQAVRQITQLERRESALTQIKARADKNAALVTKKTTPTPVPQGHKQKLKKKTLGIPFVESEALPYTTPEEHHHISVSRNFSYHLSSWLNEHLGDPATQDFLPKLQEHLLARLIHPDWTGDGNEFTPAERACIIFRNGRIYEHKILRINYTTYDVRRGQDSMNPRTHSDVMLLSPEDSTHPFSYAQVVGIFHADIIHAVPGSDGVPRRMEFLWVRRYRLDPTWRSGFRRKRLHRVEFLPADDPLAFGFLDPDEVIRGSHLIPAFSTGTTTEFLDEDSIGRPAREGLADNEDWRSYYVNLHSFVDRDMVIRYTGGGVGHYRVPIPPDDDEPIPPGPAPQEEADDLDLEADNFPEIVVPNMNGNPPAVPPADVADPDEVGADEPLDDDSGDESAGDGEPEEDAELENDEDELDFGPEDGDGDLPDEWYEGYAPL
ncbi:hypothetical protein B0H15DRAFT_920861 [Mycena belliarum]|uniref:Uncharacterized protein n=1 Tax=Mycena belliarum TaxID=1033014 RepID=A0AAD6UAI8_9AGAR|nr:hypothetical protein B0H15DRAFT_920861 [Mycena belliae]